MVPSDLLFCALLDKPTLLLRLPSMLLCSGEGDLIQEFLPAEHMQRRAHCPEGHAALARCCAPELAAVVTACLHPEGGLVPAL